MSKFSMLNTMFSTMTGQRFQHAFPSVGVLLKRNMKGHLPKQATVFTLEKIQTFLQTFLGDNGYWLLRKAAVAIGFTGLRTKELHELQFDSIRGSPDGFWVTYNPCKQVGCKESKTFLIPSGGDPRTSFFIHVANYLKIFRECEFSDGRLWRGASKTSLKLARSNLGINQLHEMTKEVAKLLNLPDPNSYTSHSLRRSSATACAEGGAHTGAMQRYYGWKNSETADRYIQGTRSQAISMSQAIVNKGLNFNSRAPKEEQSKMTDHFAFKAGSPGDNSNVVRTGDNATHIYVQCGGVVNLTR